MNTIPCGNMIERDGGSCILEDRDYPQDCNRCDAYVCGLNEQERTRCERWTRVMGYHRPVDAFNAGKKAEHVERRYFQESRVQFLEGAGHD